MKRFMTVAVTLSLALIYSGVFNAAPTNAGEPPPSPVVAPIPDGLAWREVAPAERVAILEFLQSQTRGNYERIRTFQASYLVYSEYYDSAAGVKAAFGPRLPKDSSPALIQHSESTLKVAIDMESGKVFRQPETIRFLLLTTNSREPVVIPDVRPIDNCSIVTSEDYKYFDPKAAPATNSVVANQPQGHNKRYAHRVPVENTRNQEGGDLIDPRNFYRCSSNQKSWEEMQVYLSALKGDKGAEQQKKADRLAIDQADHEGGAWYRLRMPVTSADGSKVTFTSVWSPLAGFNPVSQTVSMGDKAEEVITNSKSWKWTNIDGVFVPEEVHYVSHPKGIPENVDSLNQTITQKECVLNAPLAPDQFDYSALGLKTGDLVLDDIDQTAFMIDNGGKPTRLAAYDEKYVPEAYRGSKWNFRLMIGGAAAVIAIALAGVILFRRRRKASKK